MSHNINYECDLHAHTIRSDGKDTPKEIIDKAIDIGLKAVAITDHDTPPPSFINVNGKNINPKEYAKNHELNLILGYEFSTDTYVDDVHILGYELDWDNKLLKEEVKRAKESKSKAYRKLCELLTEKGMPINYDEEILKYTDKSGKLKNRKPVEVEKKFIFEKMVEKGFANSWEEAKILVKNDEDLSIRRPKIDPIDAINLIHKCGGIAVLAHPYLINQVVRPNNQKRKTREQYIFNLIENGLDGIEANYTYDKTSYNGYKTKRQIEKEVRLFYGNNIKISGGSDYHAGHKKNRENPRKLGEAGISFKAFKNNYLDIL